MARRNQGNPFSEIRAIPLAERSTQARGFTESVAVSPREQARVVASLTGYAYSLARRSQDPNTPAKERRALRKERDRVVRVVNDVGQRNPNQRGGITLSGDVIELVDKADNAAAEEGTGRFT